MNLEKRKNSTLSEHATGLKKRFEESGGIFSDLELRADDDKVLLRESVRRKILNSLKLFDASSLEEGIDEIRLNSYKENYSKWLEVEKSQCSWEEVKTRLLANNGKYFRLAEKLQDRGILFGIDAEGNPLIADGGDDPVLRGRLYSESRVIVLDSGYELFPSSADDESKFEKNLQKSAEIVTYERFTGKPFISSNIVMPKFTNPLPSQRVAAWLESGKNPRTAKMIQYSPESGACHIFEKGTSHESKNRNRGTKRLLRLKKSNHDGKL